MTNDVDRQTTYDHFSAREDQAREEGLLASSELLAWFKMNYAGSGAADTLPDLLNAFANAVEELERRLNKAGL